MTESTLGTCRVCCLKPKNVYVGSIEKCFGSEATYVSFYSIPYAPMPEGMKRYLPPESLASAEPSKVKQGGPSTSAASTSSTSSTVSKANAKTKLCIQMSPPDFPGSADCLYLNIFLPQLPELIKERLPVLVFFHGGGFSEGSNDPEHYSADDIVQHGLVFVTVSYRLGLYGFLNARTEEFPGNVGLKDQVQALEWIRDNIKCFNGDPDNVTISGWSAGGTCVNLHLVSPMSKGLFHKAIVQSGCIFGAWGYRGHQFKQMKTIFGDERCEELLRDEDGSKALQVRALQLLHADRVVRHPCSFSPLFGPSVEKEEEGAFISKAIEKMMEDVQLEIPVMAGFTRNEGIEQYIVNEQVDFKKWVREDKIFRQLLVDNFRWDKYTAKKNVNTIRDKYFPNRSSLSDVEMDCRFANFLHDVFFCRFYDSFKFGPNKDVHKNLYVYRFDHFSEISAVRRHRLHTFQEATHGDDVTYLYCPTTVKTLHRTSIYEGNSQNKEIRKVMKHMGSLWASFCKNGIPKSDIDSTVEWRRHTKEHPCYLSISNDLVLKEGSPFTNEWHWLHEFVERETPVLSQEVTPEGESPTCLKRFLPCI